jgi:plasmid maintenance system antidote protein VapI
MDTQITGGSPTKTFDTHRVARITVAKSHLLRTAAPQAAVSLTHWTHLLRRAKGPARLNELVRSLSPVGREAYNEVRAIILARLKSKLEAGEISRLAYFRSVARMTQAQLAQSSGIPQPNISKLERTGQVSLRMAAKLAPPLGITVAELLGLEGDRING